MVYAPWCCSLIWFESWQTTNSTTQKIFRLGTELSTSSWFGVGVFPGDNFPIKLTTRQVINQPNETAIRAARLVAPDFGFSRRRLKFRAKKCGETANDGGSQHHRRQITRNGVFAARNSCLSRSDSREWPERTPLSQTECLIKWRRAVGRRAPVWGPLTSAKSWPARRSNSLNS